MAFGQATTGTISGLASDSTGAVLPNVKVEILNLDTGISRTVQTDASGRYSAPSLSLGHYQLTASLEGFQTQVRKGIELTVGREALVNLELSVGAVTQAVEVTGEAALVESTSSSLGATVDDRTIRELPLNGRSYDQLALLQPGVVAYGGGAVSGGFDYGSGRRFTVSGSRGFSNSFLLDGTDINDHGNSTPGGAAGFNMGVEGIREFRILTDTFNAEFGRATGAVISSVTRSGTNELHGSAFEFLRNSALDARNFFDPGSAPPPFRRNQFGGAIGGPIKKDRTFFFGTYEGFRQGLGQTIVDFVPTVSVKNGKLGTGDVIVSPAIKPFLALYPDPNGKDFGDGTAQYIFSPTITTKEDYFMLRGDHQANAKNSIFGRYSFDTDSVVNPTNVAAGGGMPGFTQTQTSRRQYSTIQLSTILSPELLNNFFFAYNRTFPKSDTLPTNPLGPEFSFSPGLPMGLIQVGGASGFVVAINQVTNLGTSASVPRQWAYNLLEWADDVTLVKGRHSLKSGFRIERIRDNAMENSSVRGAYSFTGLPTLLTATPSSFQGVAAGQDAYRGLRETLLAFYGQDDFRVSPRLTLNLGLRWEAVTDPTEVNGKVSNLLHPSDATLTVTKNYVTVTKKNFEPRVGLAWQLNSRGTSVLRAGFGMFHDQILPQAYALNLAKLPPFYSILTVTNPTGFPNGYATLSRAGLPTLLEVEPHMKTPTKSDYNLSYQQQIWNNTVVQVAYVGSESYHVLGYAATNTSLPAIINGQKVFTPGAPRINTNFGTITTFMTNSISNYNALQITVTRKSSGGLQFQAFYTYAKSMDLMSAIASVDSQREPQVYMDPFDPARNRGPASFMAKNALVLTTNYLMPFKFQQKAVDSILGGWGLGLIGTIQAGQPFTVRVGSNRSSNGDNQNPDRPNLISGMRNNPSSGTTAGCPNIPAGSLGGADRYFDPCAFSFPTLGTYGNLGRNTVIGPGLVNIDLSLEKNFAIREKLHAQFRSEFFNVLNHTNFGLPTTQVFTSAGAYSGSAGSITSTITPTSARQIQFGLKLMF